MQVSEEVFENRLRSRTKFIEAIPGAIVTAAITLLFFSLYWNRFAGLRSGNGSFQGGVALLHGSLPYRDFFTAGPPLNGILSAVVLSVFGQKLIVIRAWGVFERIALALLLYFWLIKLFRARDAAFASVLAVIVAAGDPSNALSSYGVEAIFFFLASGWCVMRSMEPGESAVRFIGWSVAAGLLASLCFDTKQTLGAGATVGIPLVACVYITRLSGAYPVAVRRSATFLTAFAGGWCLGAGALLLWLLKVGVLHEFLQDVFKKGPSAKASHPSDFVIRAAHAAWALRYGFLAACAALIVSAQPLRRACSAKHRDVNQSSGMVLVAVLASVAIAVGAALAYAGKWPLQGFDSFAIYFGLFGVISLLLSCTWRLLRGNSSVRELQIGFLAAIAFGIALMVYLSWPASFDMVLPGFGLIVAAVLDGSGSWQRAVLYAVGAIMICAMTCEKLNLPQGFHEWQEPPVRLAKVRSSLPELSGLMLPPDTVRFIDETGRIVREHAGPTDTIFAYPEFGILYPLYARTYPTATDSHNIDVVNDEFARSEARRLLEAKPAVVIYYPVPEWSLRADERLWRHGERSGQRDLIAAIEKLTSTYRLVESFNVPPNDGPVKVYVRE